MKNGEKMRLFSLVALIPILLLVGCISTEHDVQASHDVEIHSESCDSYECKLQLALEYKSQAFCENIEETHLLIECKQAVQRVDCIESGNSWNSLSDKCDRVLS